MDDGSEAGCYSTENSNDTHRRRGGSGEGFLGFGAYGDGDSGGDEAMPPPSPEKLVRAWAESAISSSTRSLTRQRGGRIGGNVDRDGEGRRFEAMDEGGE
jgi:hypothetical protein